MSFVERLPLLQRVLIAGLYVYNMYIFTYLFYGSVGKWFVAKWPYLIHSHSIAPYVAGSAVLLVKQCLWSRPLHRNGSFFAHDIIIFIAQVLSEPKIRYLQIMYIEHYNVMCRQWNLWTKTTLGTALYTVPNSQVVSIGRLLCIAKVVHGPPYSCLYTQVVLLHRWSLRQVSLYMINCDSLIRCWYTTGGGGAWGRLYIQCTYMLVCFSDSPMTAGIEVLHWHMIHK